MTGTALVLGGGFAGMLVARALADFFDRVIVFERDLLADDAQPRRGVPQGPQIHQPLVGAMECLAQFFPGIPQALSAAGAAKINITTETCTFARGRWAPQRDFGLVISMQTRGLLEHVMRKQLSETSNVSTRYGRKVVGLLKKGERIVGAIAQDADGSEEASSADLIVDAGGRNSRVRRWLSALGYGEPRASKVNVDVRYVSCLVRIPPGLPDTHRGLRIRDAPPSPRAGTCLPVENNQWLVSLAGRFGDYPPVDVDGLVTFAEGLPAPGVAQRLRSAEITSEPASYFFPSSLHWHYEAMERFPDRLLPIGDIVMCLNPLYGQGLATAGLQVRILAEELAARRTSRSGLDGVTASVLRRCSDALEYPWMTAAVADFEFDQTSGDRPTRLQERSRFAQALTELSDQEPEVHEVALRVQQLIDPPELLTRYGIHDRVLARLAI